MNEFQTDRNFEESHLSSVCKVIRENCSSLKAQIADMQDTIDKLSESYHDGDTEVWTILNNTIVMQESAKLSYAKNLRGINKPFFGRIIFTDETLNKKDSLYIGKGGIYDDPTTPLVVDWRAPIANAYYENGLGRVSYVAPNDTEMVIDLSLKRTFEIDEGKLLDYFDTDVVSNDELLTKYLGKNKEAVLGEIIATIQKEQNDIIRKTPYHNVIVQGAAGSGKTTVAMHRISYILYNYPDRVKPDDFYIIGSNKMLLQYITGVLPDLDVTGVRQMTLEELFVRLLYEEWDANKYSIKSMDTLTDASVIKGTSDWFAELKKYCRKYESDTVAATDVYLFPDQFVEGILNDKPAILDKREELGSRAREPVLLMDVLEIDEYLKNATTVSTVAKIAMLNEKLDARLENATLGKGVSYTEKEKKAIKKYFKNYFNKFLPKESIFDLYDGFLKEMRLKGNRIHTPSGSFDVYDLAALAVIYKKLKEEEEISEAHHIIIDEAQDYGMMAYLALNECIKGCTYTIMGDISQNIRFGYGLNNWSDLVSLLNTTDQDSFCTLLKSYRNTVEISEFATTILDHGDFEVYPVNPIVRHGNKPHVIATDNITDSLLTAIKDLQTDGHGSIAVVCRNENEAKAVSAELSPHIELLDTNPETATFGVGVMVLPVSLTKGLEFDAVIIYNPTKENYPLDNGHAKLLYVAATRALHELYIISKKDDVLTELITKPVPADKKRHELAETEVADPAIAAKERLEQKNARNTQNSNERARILENKVVADPLKKAESKPTAAPKAPVVTPSTQSSIKGSVFGSPIPESALTPPGHTIVSTSIKMVNKSTNGLMLTSQGGVLRVMPVNENVVRFTFSKEHPAPSLTPMYRNFQYKDNGRQIELATKEFNILIDRSAGYVSFRDKGKREVLCERMREPRFFTGTNAYLYFKNAIIDSIHAVNTADYSSTYMKNSAKLITNGDKSGALIYVKDKFGIYINTDTPAYFCDIAAFGAHFKLEGNVLDYYFIKANTSDEIINLAKQI